MIKKDTNNTDHIIFKYSKQSVEELFNKFKTGENGYNESRALKLLNKYGPNEIEVVNESPWYKTIIKSFFNSFNIILLVIIIISIFTDIVFAQENSYSRIIVLSAIIFVSGLINFVQDQKSKKSVAKLKEMVSNTTAVIREGIIKEIPLEEVVIGDLIKLSAGDIIPADLRIVSSKDLYISQSSLTGESEPVEKHRENTKETKNVFDLENICFMGTNVISGTAICIVVATSNDTYFGKMSKNLNTKPAVTAFDRGIKKMTSLIIKLTLVMSVLVFILNIIFKGNILDSFIYSLVIAVGVMPELLIVIVSSNLAKGSTNMANKKVIIKELQSIQNLGAMDILCTDKTGTITEDKIVLQRYLDVHGDEDLRILKHAYLNSYYQTGLKNLLDLAIIEKAKEVELEEVYNEYKKIDELPFDFTRRRMSIILANTSNKRQILTKGAVEEILEVTKYVEKKGFQVEEITEELKSEVLSLSKKLNKEGLRVIAIAQKKDIDINKEIFNVDDESEMTLIGFVAFLDPPKSSAKKAIASLHQHGVDVKVISGDNEIVCEKVCREVGISTKKVLLGEQIEQMTDEELSMHIKTTNVFAKTAPMQKARIVKLLQEQGHVVGYMGDGINDAPALLQADVGISVDSGTEITKEVASVILLEKSLMVLEDGMLEGRRIFANINKYFKMAISSNVGNMVSIIFASIFIPFLPMLPIHVLVQNLLYDVSQLCIPFDNVDAEYLHKPKRWETNSIYKFIAYFAPVSTIFDLVTFGVLWYILGANTLAAQSLFQTGWFILGLLSQTIIVHVIRTSKVPFYKSKASPVLVLGTLLISIIGIIIPFTELGVFLKMTPLPKSYFISLVIIILMYILLTELIKKLYLKYNKEWV